MVVFLLAQVLLSSSPSFFFAVARTLPPGKPSYSYSLYPISHNTYTNTKHNFQASLFGLIPVAAAAAARPARPGAAATRRLGPRNVRRALVDPLRRDTVLSQNRRELSEGMSYPVPYSQEPQLQRR